MECQRESARPSRGVVVECSGVCVIDAHLNCARTLNLTRTASGSNVTVLDSSNNVATYSDDKVSAVFSSFAVVAQVGAKCHKNAVQQCIDFMRAHCYNHTHNATTHAPVPPRTATVAP